MKHKRKYESGCEKRKKKKQKEELARSQRGAIDKFFPKKSDFSTSNENVVDVDDFYANDVDVSDDSDHIAARNDDNVHLNDENHEIRNNDVDMNVKNACFDNDENVDCAIPNISIDAQNDDDNVCDDVDNQMPSNDFHMPDIFDPRTWDGLDCHMVDILAVKGPKRDLSFEKGRLDKIGRHFSTSFYTRVLPNGEKCDRDWLVYSKELDKVFCFCCKLFKKGVGRGRMANEGFNDWAHLCVRIREHETSMEHIQNMTTWYELRLRLQKVEGIDKIAQKQLEKEKEHWKNVLLRIISIVKFLGKHSLAFRGTNEKLYESSNGNFLGLIEMIAEFDPIMQEHVRRITNDEIHIHYLGHNIQNELILLLANAIKSKLVMKIKEAKYFSVILDCTPDISHQEQMSIILRYVDVSSNCVSIEESFLGFLNVNDTTGQGLFDVLLHELKVLDLNVDDVRGQSYDNGSNMKGKNQGVQRKLLDINPRAFYTPCGAHSLNLMLCDMATNSRKARDFFGIIQRIYTIFAKSTKRWEILQKNVKEYTPKSMSCTRWESRVESVKAIRLQISDFREALLEVADNENDLSIESEARSLANNELGDFEFIVAIVIWYELLSTVNSFSKKLQSKDMLVGVAIENVKKLIAFFKEYRENGFSNALEVAKEIALDMDVDPAFLQKRQIKRKRQFDESLDDESVQSAEESFRINFFNCIIDQAIVSLHRRFEQYEQYETLFGFLFSSDKLHSLDDPNLKSSCYRLAEALKNGDKCDIHEYDLYVELKLLQEFLPNEKLGALDILKIMKRVDCFPNAIIAYRILLTIPVTVASAERSFSKLKLIKTYLRNSMSQDRLNGLAMVAIENELLDNIDCEDLIDEFASKNARRTRFFK